MGEPHVAQNPRVCPGLLSYRAGIWPVQFQAPSGCPMNVVMGEAVALRQLSQWQCATQLCGPRRLKLQAPHRQ
ncbi:hypothetical protein GCM10011324_19670 [Allosediminivita pacifica]|nr:hypothetical protein GCM10011324_19670 [Allosediminivita pacifica]